MGDRQMMAGQGVGLPVWLELSTSSVLAVASACTELLAEVCKEEEGECVEADQFTLRRG